MARYSNNSVQIHTAEETSGAVNLQITEYNDNLNTSLLAPESGDTFNRIHTIDQQQPDIGFSSLLVENILGLIGSTGKCITNGGAGGPGVTFFNERHSQCGTDARGGAGTNRSALIAEGHLFINSISADRSGYVSVNLTAHAISEAGSVPITYAYNVNLPASVTNEPVFGLGPMRLGGTYIYDLANLSIDFGPQFTKPVYAGSIYPRVVDTTKVLPIITATLDDASILDESSLKIAGTECAHANSEIWFYRRQANAAGDYGGGYYSLGTIVHLKGTFAGFAHAVQPHSASGTATGTTQIQIACSNDGTNAPLVWTPNQQSTVPTAPSGTFG